MRIVSITRQAYHRPSLPRQWGTGGAAQANARRVAAIADERRGASAWKPAAPATAKGRMRTWLGGDMAYVDPGSGEPALVFVHCGNCRKEIWTETLDAFAPTHRVVAMDLPGPRPLGGGSPAAYPREPGRRRGGAGRAPRARRDRLGRQLTGGNPSRWRRRAGWVPTGCSASSPSIRSTPSSGSYRRSRPPAGQGLPARPPGCLHRDDGGSAGRGGATSQAPAPR